MIRFRHTTLLAFLILWLRSPLILAQENATDAMAQGQQSYQQGDYNTALARFSEASTYYHRSGNTTAETQALLRQAEIFKLLDRNDAAIKTLQQAFTLNSEPAARATVLGSLGTVYFSVGKTSEAEHYFKDSFTVARSGNIPAVAAVSCNNLGNLLVAEKRYPEALNRYREGIQLAETADDKLLAAKLHSNAARLSLNHELGSKPDDFLTSAKHHLTRAGDSLDKVLVMVNLGQMEAQRAEQRTTGSQHSAAPSQTYQTLLAALKIAERLQDQYAISYASGYLGALYEKQSRYADALPLTHRALFIAQSIHKPELLYRWEWQMGRILRQQGENDRAIAAYQRAISALQPIRHELLVAYRASDQSFREAVGALYFELADLLLRHHTAASAPQHTLQDLLEARKTVELVKSVELEDYFQDDCVASLQSKTRGIDTLAPRTAALYPIILNDRIELLLSLPQGISLTTVPIPKTELTAKVRDLRRYLEKRTTRQYLTYAQALYRILIEPIAKRLRNEAITTLIFIPDDPLRTIPIAALHDGEHYLIEQYAIATTPGLTLTDPRPIRRQGARFLLNGLSRSTQGYPALPYVDKEIQSIARLYDSRVLENENFRVDRMQRELAQLPFNVVHIASHGQFGSNIDNTFLLAYDGKIKMDKLEQILGISRYRDTPVELLTLSACQTAAGDDRAALGLAGIAVKAGARSALASLWYLNDPASALLIEKFYARLRDPSVTKARALQAAQIELLQDRRYRHPSFWAPFLLIGNWL